MIVTEKGFKLIYLSPEKVNANPTFWPYIVFCSQSRAGADTLSSRRDLKHCLAAMTLQVLLNGANFVL